MLKHLFRPAPKWQSPKSQRRLEAIAEFMPEQPRDLELLVRMAREDSEPAVRREAVRKLHDLDLLQQIQRRDLESAVRDAAAQRFNELLAGQSPQSPGVGHRVSRIRQISSMQTLGYLIKEGQPIDVKIAAVEQISDEILLEGIALKSGIARLRQLAAERISNPRVLESLAGQSRQGDKSVYRIARDKLDALHALDKGRQQRQERLQTLCEAMEQHARSAFNPLYAARAESLIQQWQEVSEAAEAALAERFDTARDLALGIVQEHRQAEDTQRQRIQAEAEQRATCETLESALAELAATPDSFDQSALAALVKTQQLRWQVAGESLTAAEPLAERFQQAMQRLRDAQALMEAVHQERERLSSGIAAAQAEPAPGVSELAPLSEIVEKLPPSQGLPLPSILRMAYRLLESQGQDVAASQADEAARDQARSRLAQLLEALDNAIQAGNSKLAGRKLREAQQLTRNHHLHEPRLTQLMGRLRELKDWAGFAIVPKKEALLADMKALAGRSMEPEARADAIKALQASWKALGVNDPHLENPLWEQFRAAADQAYEPCKAYFEAQRELRQQHTRQRETVCQELEAYLAAPPVAAGPRQLEELIRTARQEWQRYHPVERQQAKPLQQRFGAIMKGLEERLKSMQHAGEAGKRQLIADASALVGADDNRAACQRIKELQQAWKQIEPGRHKTDQALWKEFRGACDQVFARRDAEIETRKAGVRALTEQAGALIAALHELAASATAGAPDSGQAARLEEAFRALALPRDQRQALHRQFDDARRGYEKKLREAQAGAREAAQAALQTALRLCLEGSERLQAGEMPDRAALEAARTTAMSGPWAAPLRQGLDALLLLADDANAPATWQAASAADADTAHQLCLELEILLDLPSPDEVREARLQKQMEMLQESAFHRRGGNPEQKAAEKLQALFHLRLPAALGPRLEALLRSGRPGSGGVAA